MPPYKFSFCTKKLFGLHIVALFFLISYILLHLLNNYGEHQVMWDISLVSLKMEFLSTKHLDKLTDCTHYCFQMVLNSLEFSRRIYLN